jgi:hypothetical protein
MTHQSLWIFLFLLKNCIKFINIFYTYSITLLQPLLAKIANKRGNLELVENPDY